MHCREVKRRIDNGEEITPEITRHLRICPDCARAAQATNMMRDMFETARTAAPTLSFEAVRTRAKAAVSNLTTLERIMLTIQDRFQSRPVLWAACALGLMAFSFVALVPISYTQTVGYTVSVAGLGERLGTSPELLNAAMTASGLEDISVSSSVDNGVESYVFAPIASETEAHGLAGALAGLTDADTEPTVEPIRQKASGTLLAQVTERKVVEKDPPARIRFDKKRIIINGERLDGVIFSRDSSDSAVKALFEQIFSKLSTGTAKLNVDVKTADDSTYRVVTIELDPLDAEPGAKPVRVYMDDNEVGATWDDNDVINRLGKLIEMEFPGRDDTMMAGSVVLKVKLKE